MSGLLLGGLAAAGLAAMAAGGGGGGDEDDSGAGAAPEDVPQIDGGEAFLRFGIDETMPSGSPGEFETGEYEANYSLSMIAASHRYAAGATGRGTLGAILDSGADVTHRELTFGINREISHSYFTGDNDVRDYTGHGTAVAGIVAAEKDDFGMHGVAFEASLMILQGLDRWDHDPDTNMTVGFDAVWADSQRRAYRAGAAAINHSWTLIDPNDGESFSIDDFASRDDLGAFVGGDVLDALNGSRANDLVTVFATGNDGNAEASAVAALPVHYGEFASHWIAVTALDEDRQIAPYANHCGAAQDFCLAAPGSGILVPDSKDAVDVADAYWKGSGTSFAAPHVTGAALLLKSQFPELTAPEVTAILFETAEDLGAPGTDAVYGRGLLDLENAVKPQGALNVQMAATVGEEVASADESYIAASRAFAPALTAALSGRHVMITDGYDRGYSADMGDFIVEQNWLDRAASRLEDFALDRSEALSVEAAGQALHLARGMDPALAAFGADWAYPEPLAVPYAGLLEDGTFVRHEVDLAPAASVQVTAATDGAGSGGAYFSTGVALRSGGAEVSLEFGQLAEQGAVLGTSFGGGFGDAADARTGFARIGGNIAVASGLSLHASASWGRTDFSQSGIVTGGGLRSSALGLGVAADDVLGGRLTLGVSRPLTVSGGEIELDVPIAVSAAENGVRTNRVIRETAAVALDSGDDPLDLQIGHSMEVGPARVALGGLYRAAGPGEGDMAASVGVSFTF